MFVCFFYLLAGLRKSCSVVFHKKISVEVARGPREKPSDFDGSLVHVTLGIELELGLDGGSMMVCRWGQVMLREEEEEEFY